MQNRKRPTDTEDKSVVTKGERGEGEIRDMGLTNTNYYTHNREATRIYCMAQGIIPITL